MNLKGSLPLLILQIVAERECHGYEIAQIIKLRSAGILDFREGTLYPMLHTLEHKGSLASFEQVEQGRTRRYYRMTEVGRAMLAEEREAWTRYSHAVNAALGEA